MGIMTDIATGVQFDVLASVNDPAFIGPRTQHTLLEMSSSVTFTVNPGARFEYTGTGYVEGWNHRGPAAEDIIVVWDEPCDCHSPCCKGERRRHAEIAWDQIDVLWSGEGYTSPVLWERHGDDNDCWSDYPRY